MLFWSTANVTCHIMMWKYLYSCKCICLYVHGAPSTLFIICSLLQDTHIKFLGIKVEEQNERDRTTKSLSLSKKKYKHFVIYSTYKRWFKSNGNNNSSSKIKTAEPIVLSGGGETKNQQTNKQTILNDSHGNLLRAIHIRIIWFKS